MAYKVWTFPPAFWFVVLLSFTLLHAVQVLSVLFILNGALIIHSRYEFSKRAVKEVFQGLILSRSR